MKAKEIQRILDKHFIYHKYQLKNVYIYHSQWESDWFSIDPKGLCIDIEIKTSYADFKNDFNKKHRHQTLSSARSNFLISAKECPHRFYFCCPVDIIPITEVPAYAGLIEIQEDKVVFKKKAPLLHSDTTNLKGVLLDKFYYRNLNIERRNQQLEKEIEFFQSDTYHQQMTGTPHIVAPEYHDFEKAAEEIIKESMPKNDNSDFLLF